MGKANAIYHFTHFTLKLEERQLLREGKLVSVAPKVFDTLAYLVANAGRLVTKTELLAKVWPNTFVEEVTLARTISDLRKVPGSSPQARKLIETVPKYGYRFVASEQTPLAPVTVSRTVGREADSDRLRGVMESVSAGSGAVVTISGEAGIGKTTVAEDFLAEVEGPRASTWVGRGRCSERLAETDAFAPLLECLEDFMRGEFGEQAAQAIRPSPRPGTFRLLRPRVNPKGLLRKPRPPLTSACGESLYPSLKRSRASGR